MNLVRNEKLALAAMAVCAVIAAVTAIAAYTIAADRDRTPYFVCILFLVLAIAFCYVDIYQYRKSKSQIKSRIGLRLKHDSRPKADPKKFGKGRIGMKK